jgi:hypothetical protein
MNNAKDIPADQPPLVEVTTEEYGAFLRAYPVDKLQGNVNRIVFPTCIEWHDFTVSSDLGRSLQAYRREAGDENDTEKYFIRKALTRS